MGIEPGTFGLAAKKCNHKAATARASGDVDTGCLRSDVHQGDTERPQSKCSPSDGYFSRGIETGLRRGAAVEDRCRRVTGCAVEPHNHGGALFVDKEHALALGGVLQDVRQRKQRSVRIGRWWTRRRVENKSGVVSVLVMKVGKVARGEPRTATAGQQTWVRGGRMGEESHLCRSTPVFKAPVEGHKVGVLAPARLWRTSVV